MHGQDRKIISKCTEIDAAKRYSSIDDLKKDLDTGIFNFVKSSPAEKFISAVPGLRSPDIKVAVASVAAYVLSFTVMVVLVVRPSQLGSDMFIRFLNVLFIIIIPFISLSDFMNIWEKIFFTKNADKKAKKKIAWMVTLISFLIAFLIGCADMKL